MKIFMAMVTVIITSALATITIMIITFTIVFMRIAGMILATLTSTSAKAPQLAPSKSRSIEAAIVPRPKIA